MMNNFTVTASVEGEEKQREITADSILAIS
jgi:hypothetical protein